MVDQARDALAGYMNALPDDPYGNPDLYDNPYIEYTVASHYYSCPSVSTFA